MKVGTKVKSKMMLHSSVKTVIDKWTEVHSCIAERITPSANIFSTSSVLAALPGVYFYRNFTFVFRLMRRLSVVYMTEGINMIGNYSKRITPFFIATKLAEMVLDKSYALVISLLPLCHGARIGYIVICYLFFVCN